jgi:hypothetical protein
MRNRTSSASGNALEPGGGSVASTGNAGLSGVLAENGSIDVHRSQRQLGHHRTDRLPREAAPSRTPPHLCSGAT